MTSEEDETFLFILDLCKVEALTTRLSRIIQSVHGGGDGVRQCGEGCWHEHIEE